MLIREKRKADSASDKGSANVRGKGIGSLVRTLLLAIVLILVLCGWLIYLLLQQQQTSASVATAKIGATQLARNISEKIAFYSIALENFVTKQEVLNYFTIGNKGDLMRQEEDFKRLLPNVERIQMLPPDWDIIGPNKAPGQGFAYLDMLYEAKKATKPTAAEIHMFATKDRHIALAAAVRDQRSDEVIGLVHVQLPITLVTNALNSWDNSAGWIEIQQVSGEQDVIPVASTIETGTKEVAAGHIAIEGTIWQLAYGQSAAKWTVQHMISFWGVITFGVLALAGLLLTLYQRLKSTLRHDQTRTIGMVEALMSGKGVRAPKAGIAELQGTMDQLAGMGKKFSGQKEKTPVTEGLSAEGNLAIAAIESPSLDDAATSADSAMERAVSAKAAGYGELDGGGIPHSLFRTCDIRGVVGETLKPRVVFELARAIGSEAQARGRQALIVARDGRLSSEQLFEALCSGVRATGCTIIDIGMVPTPVLYFATHFLDSDSGVMLTGSSNPADYNGLKIVLAGESLSEGAVQQLLHRVEQADLTLGEGDREERELVSVYLDHIVQDIQLAYSMRVVIDSGNGVAGICAPTLLRELGCEVIELNSEVNGGFPNHPPDPGNPENLQPLINAVKEHKANVGIAFDGDGDRLGIVDSRGVIIWPDRLLMLFARDVLSRQPGADMIYDVKSTRHLAGEILASGGRPIMWRCGHSLMQAKMRETRSQLAGEMNGHIYFKDRWYGFDDGIYAGARLLELLSLDPRSSAEVFAELPDDVATPELLLPLKEGESSTLMRKIEAVADFKDAKLVTIDGIRAEFEDGWGLVRASATRPALRFRFEADTKKAMSRIQTLFKQQLLAIDEQLKLPF